MGEILVYIFKVAIFAAPVVIAASFLSLFIIMGLNYISSPVNTNVLEDIFALVQIWLPFNLDVMLLFILTGSGIWLAYRFALLTLNFLRLVVAPDSGSTDRLN